MSPQPVLSWDAERVGVFLDELGFDWLSAAFQQHGVDGRKVRCYCRQPSIHAQLVLLESITLSQVFKAFPPQSLNIHHISDVWR